MAIPSLQARQLEQRVINRIRGGSVRVYQLDVTAYPGNSGSPLFDVASGKVIGIVNQAVVRNTKEAALSNPTGITYAIPVRYLGELLSGSQ